MGRWKAQSVDHEGVGTGIPIRQAIALPFNVLAHRQIGSILPSHYPIATGITALFAHMQTGRLAGGLLSGFVSAKSRIRCVRRQRPKGYHDEWSFPSVSLVQDISSPQLRWIILLCVGGLTPPYTPSPSLRRLGF